MLPMRLRRSSVPTNPTCGRVKVGAEVCAARCPRRAIINKPCKNVPVLAREGPARGSACRCWPLPSPFRGQTGQAPRESQESQAGQGSQAAEQARAKPSETTEAVKITWVPVSGPTCCRQLINGISTNSQAARPELLWPNHHTTLRAAEQR